MLDLERANDHEAELAAEQQVAVCSDGTGIRPILEDRHALSYAE
jgi:hypothetical protein